jgi:glycosyltransferase involved in cell wall biosynthesis
MTTLSVVIITYNEERNIERCIRSVRPIADEIIVLDSFSTDRTPDLVRKLGGCLHQQTFTGYGAQKNEAMRLASQDYILYLDADELLSEELCLAIEAEKEKGFPADGYTMNRLNNYCGRWIFHGSWYPDKKLRIARRGRSNWSEDFVHESLVMKDGSKLGHLKGNLLHYTYSNMEEHVEKNNRYSTLSAEWMHRNGRRTHGFRILFNPFWAFFTSYIIRAGFLDGFYGFVIAVNIAHLTFLKYVKLYQLQKRMSI